MAINTTYYGTLSEAAAYFDGRLHATAWTNATSILHEKALRVATRVLDTLNYKGYKATVFALLQQHGLTVIPDVLPDTLSLDDIRAAEATQPLQFPRGEDVVVPEDIRVATYEIAYSLLDGKDPEQELENLAVSSQGYGSLRTTYSRNQVPIEHIINGVPNAQAWRLIRPFLRDGDAVALSRVS